LNAFLAFEAQVSKQALEPAGKGLAIANDLPAAAMAAVDRAREGEQVGRDRVELHPGRDDEVDEAELGRARVVAEVAQERGLPFGEDRADGRVRPGQRRRLVEAAPEVRDGWRRFGFAGMERSVLTPDELREYCRDAARWEQWGRAVTVR